MVTLNLLAKSMVGLVGVAFITLPATEAAQATSFTFTTSQSEFTPGVRNQGWWGSPNRPNTNTTNENYLVGTLGAGNRFVHRNFFTFDLSSLSPTETIESVTLQLTRFNASTVDPTETLGLFDVTTPADRLNNNQGTNATTGTPEDILSFELNQAAIADIQSRAGQTGLNGFFSIGGALLSISRTAGNEFLFSYNSNSNVGGVQRLVVTTVPRQNPESVPEPSTVAALLLTGFATLRYRKKQQQDQQ
jgi:hypothetical protein